MNISGKGSIEHITDVFQSIVLLLVRVTAGDFQEMLEKKMFVLKWVPETVAAMGVIAKILSRGAMRGLSEL